MKLYWIKKCIENGYRCPHCQLIMADANGQMPFDSKNHRIQMLDGQVKCAACNTTIGYFPRGYELHGDRAKFGLSEKILDSVDYVTAIDQKEKRYG